MSEFLGTPGPWKVGICGNVEDSNGRYIAESDSERRTVDENEANNRLISCAPELLEAVEVLYNRYVKYGGQPDLQDKISKLIQKATNL